MTRTRSAFTAEQKAEAVNLAFQIGTKAAAFDLGISCNSIQSWMTRRREGLPLAATPKKSERPSHSERPVSPELPEGVTTVDENGRLRTPRSLFVSVAPATGWWYEDRSAITAAVARYKHSYEWRHVAVLAFAIVERVNVGEPPWREVVGLVPRSGLDQQVMVEECFHESELDCLVSGKCHGHTETIDTPIKEKLI
jgi:transposase-like protein